MSDSSISVAVERRWNSARALYRAVRALLGPSALEIVEVPPRHAGTQGISWDVGAPGGDRSVLVMGPEGRSKFVLASTAARLWAEGKLQVASSLEQARAELGLPPAFHLTEGG